MGNVAGTCSDALGEVCTVGEERSDRKMKSTKMKSMAQWYPAQSSIMESKKFVVRFEFSVDLKCSIAPPGRNDISAAEAGVILPDDVVQSLKATRRVELEVFA